MSFLHQYFAFGLGGAVVAAILGFVIIRERRGILSLSSCLKKSYNPLKNGSLVLAWTLGIVLVVFLSYFFGYILIGTTYALPQAQADTLSGVLSSIPANSSVMAQSNVASHLFYVKDIEILGAWSQVPFSPEAPSYLAYRFIPDYVIIDTNATAGCLSCDTPTVPSDYSVQWLNNYLYNYTEIYNGSGIGLFRRK